MNERKIDRLSSASLTVEAAMVMPVILFVIVLTVYYLLFLYNRSVLTDAAYLAVKQTTYYETQRNRDIEKIVKEKCEESLKGKLVGIESVALTISVGKFQTRADLSAQLRIPSQTVLGFRIPFREIRVTAIADRLNPAGVIRLARKGKQIKEWFMKNGEERNEGEVQTGYELQLSDSSAELQLLPGKNVLQE